MADTTGELYVLLTEEKKKNEELEAENAALRKEKDYLLGRISILEAESKNANRRNRPPNSIILDYILQ